MASGIIILYLISLAVSAIMYTGPLYSMIRLIIFAVFIILLSVALALVLAIKKNPIIEKGNYELNRIKGKKE